MGLQVAYLALTALMVIIILIIGFSAIGRTFGQSSKAIRKKALLTVCLLLWQLYIFAMDKTGLLHTYELPPRFVIFMILPAFIFTGIFIYKNRNQVWLQNIPKSWLIFYQTFRILIESLFVYTVAAGILHSNVTIEGYNYDMVFAITAPIIGFLFLKKWISEKFLIIWNYIGLAVIAFIIFLFLTTIYAPHIYGSDTMLMPIDFIDYPYSIVPGFLMPSAVFMHVLSIVQLTKSNKKYEI